MSQDRPLDDSPPVGASQPTLKPSEGDSPPVLSTQKADRAEAVAELTPEALDRVMRKAFALLAADEARREGKIH